MDVPPPPRAGQECGAGRCRSNGARWDERRSEGILGAARIEAILEGLCRHHDLSFLCFSNRVGVDETRGREIY